MGTDNDENSNASDKSSEQTDRTLLQRFQAGESDAATALYLRYADRLQRLADHQTSPKMAVRVDPEGVVQSVFRTFFRRASSGQYQVAQGEDLWNLFLVIALNKIRSTAKHHRAAKRDVAKTHSLSEFGPSGRDQSLREEEALNILRLTIEELLHELPENQKQIVFLRIDGYEVAEIAEKTARAKRSVERILQNFRSRLKSMIESGGDSP